MANKLNMTELEKEIALVENDAIAEEQYNADCNYAVLDKELKIIISSIPFSSVGKYSVGRDYSDVDRLSFQKQQNAVYLDKQKNLELYCKNGHLYNKVNSITEKPIINLFGDTNQMITKHGIKDWALLSMIPKTYTLEENFRNTNQIVDYCNKKLDTHMWKIGVDMSPVNEYDTLDQASSMTTSIRNNAVFIVKDEYSVSDLESLLMSYTNIKNYEIYTVKAAKGLEFKEVFVFDSNMTINEKYISYTRALAKLNIIRNLPEIADRNSMLIVQGDKQENNEEQNPKDSSLPEIENGYIKN